MKKENRLTFIEFVENKGTYRQALFLCSCGNIKEIRYSRVMSSETRSCGCITKERLSMMRKTHGKSFTIEFYSWSSMKQRCLNKKCKDYTNYGARGIEICSRWMEFENFLMDMGKRPSIKHTLDRINVNGNYEPTNCRWATAKVQNNNRRNSLRIKIGEESKTASQWEARFGYKSGLIRDRYKAGWRGEKLLQPPRKQKLGLVYKNATYSGKELSVKFGIDIEVVYSRAQRGWSAEKIISTPVRKTNPSH